MTLDVRRRGARRSGVRHPAAAAAALLVAVALVGCGPQAPSSPSGPATDATTGPGPTTSREPLVTTEPSQEPTRPAEPPTGTAPPTTTPPTAGTPAAVAVADLAARLDVAPEQVTVVRADAVTWRDGSMGCPRPGMSYTQALVEGTLVVLEVDGRRYEYHSGGRRAPFLCESPEAPVGGDVS
ncbi:hypothetical protein [Cellulomonas carbonis]|uniref:Lipoprotein n=1 Tax=Cellulomonas carbonis T26 TaxID=947969 RepID=A0A0A0BRQ9_9CELL|nr:hypothetical protein [Cellulomonas carbonis]KGM09789.1 hypothetical protein N868_18710 [Cellulomonas carbonis T26]GGC14931.1 hypothetical protein GCM10010972_30250 [Cellulomonas carbonis]